MAKNVKINGVTYDVSGGKVQIPLASDPNTLVEFVDTSDANISAGDVKAGQTYYADGKKNTGTMPVNDGVNKTLDASDASIDIPAGYTPGGTVKVVPETKSVTPSTVAQDVTPSDGKMLSKVTVGKIPDKYKDVSGVTASVTDVKEGVKFVDSTGSLKEGTHTDPSFTLADGVLTIR